MAVALLFDRAAALTRQVPPAAPFCALLVLPALACAAAAPVTDSAAPDAAGMATTPATNPAPRLPSESAIEEAGFQPPAFGPAPRPPSVPSDAELEASGAVIGKILIDNQNIFNLDDPKDNVPLFRLADRLHGRTRPWVIRDQLLFKAGDRYSRRLLDESERILRADSYFYDAWILPVSYHDGKVDVRVTTRDVWTLNPGFNFGRSGGTNSTGVELQDTSIFGTGADIKVEHSSSIDRTSNQLNASDQHAFGTWVSAAVNYAQLSDGSLRELSAQEPFYSFETRWAAGVYGLNDLQIDKLWDHSQIIDEFHDLHQGAQIYGGLSSGLQNGWVRRWSAGVTYDEHIFSPVSTWTGVIQLPQDRRFTYPWLQFDLIQDDYARLWNHDEIGRTEDFYFGTAASARVGWASAGAGSNQSALIFTSNASRGLRSSDESQTLLLFWDFSGRVQHGELYNGIMDASVRYYWKQTKNWLFFTTFYGTKGWRLDLDDQILLGGDSGLRGYPMRYQDGTGRALWTVEQRYFTDWYPFRLFRVGGAVFFDAGRTWGNAPLAEPSLGTLKDAGFGARFGNARTGYGNVVHVDVAFPLNAASNIAKVQFLVTTQSRF